VKYGENTATGNLKKNKKKKHFAFNIAFNAFNIHFVSAFIIDI